MDGVFCKAIREITPNKVRVVGREQWQNNDTGENGANNSFAWGQRPEFSDKRLVYSSMVLQFPWTLFELNWTELVQSTSNIILSNSEP